MDGDFNIAKWKSKPALLNQRVCRIKKSINEINLDYFFYLLPIPLLEINKSTSSITVKHLSNKQIENMLFPIPPVSEQYRIVETIEKLFSRLDQIQKNIV
ncbi:MAG: restriction endonuclease subunit S [Treponema sp.]|nr:restriction endonuclease subunit S [Treponema sp.]